MNIKLFSYPTPKESFSEEDINKIKNIISYLVNKEYDRLLEIRKVETNFLTLNLFEDRFLCYESSSDMVISYLNSLRHEKKGWFMTKTVWYDKPAIWDFDRYGLNWLNKIPDHGSLSAQENKKRYDKARDRVFTAKDILRKTLKEFYNNKKEMVYTFKK